MKVDTIVRWSTTWRAGFPPRTATQFALVLVFGLTGCTGPAPVTAELPATPGFTRETLSTGGFDLVALRRGTPASGGTLTIYIEGDGRPFRHRYRPAADPTPRHATGLALAVRDAGPNVIYLARPCQFQPRPLPASCTPDLWTTARYSEAVIAAMNGAVDRVAAGFDRVVLAGYSGGGTVATLVAARRTDVALLITVAANLDHARWTALHGVSPLAGSLDAAAVARSVQHIPQVHLVGDDDEVVPEEIARAFAARMTDTTRTAIRVVPGFDHECCWAEAWPRLLREIRTPSAASP